MKELALFIAGKKDYGDTFTYEGIEFNRTEDTVMITDDKDFVINLKDPKSRIDGILDIMIKTSFNGMTEDTVSSIKDSIKQDTIQLDLLKLKQNDVADSVIHPLTLVIM